MTDTKTKLDFNVKYDELKTETGNWAGGTAILRGGRIFKWEVKHFLQPSMFGIRAGKVSKLLIEEQHRDGVTVTPVLCYDRGWPVDANGNVLNERRVNDGDVHAVFRRLIEEFN